MLPAMRAPRYLTLAATTLVLAAPLASCSKNSPGTNVKLAGEGEPGGPGAGDGTETKQIAQGRSGPVEKIEIRASATGVGDMLDAGTKLFNMWSPPEPGAPAVNFRVVVADILVESGFAPGFFESLALDDAHVIDAGIPQEGQQGVSDADIDFAAVLSSTDGQRTLDGLPAMIRPQPMGDGLYQFIDESLSLFFRPRADALEIAAMRIEALDVAAGLRAQVDTGPDAPRVNVRVTNLPPVDIDISDLLPLPDAIAGPMSAVVNEAEATALALDFGTDRALMVRASAEAPFERLGLDPIGAPVTGQSELAKALPSDAIGVWLMPWGDPKLLHEVLDRYVPLDMIPAPFDGYAGEIMNNTHALLDLIEGEVLATAYVEKGELSVVLAGEIRDESATRKATRAMFEAAEKAFGDHIAVVGGSDLHKYSVSFKRDTIKVGGARGDLFKLTAPKNMHDDLEEVSWFVGSKKPQLEVSSVVVDGKLIVAIGAGQKATMKAISRSVGRGDGLEAGGGLALARKLSDGCQYCVFLDPVEAGELFFTIMSSAPNEAKEVREAADKALATLRKLALDGELALGLRLADDQGVLGFGVPKTLLFADPDEVKTVVDLVESLDEAEQAAWEARSSSEPR